MTRQGADLRGKSAGTKAGRLLNGFTFQRAGLLANPGFVQSSKIVSFNCGLLRTFPKPSLKRDRIITKATTVSPLSPRCQPVLRTIRALLKEFLVTFVSQTKVTRPSACEASGAKPHLADFAPAKPL